MIAIKPTIITNDSTPTNTILRFEPSRTTAGGGGSAGAGGRVGKEGTGGSTGENGGHSPGGTGNGFARGGAGKLVPRPPTMEVKSLGPVGGRATGPGAGPPGKGSGPLKNSVALPTGSALGSGDRKVAGGPVVDGAGGTFHAAEGAGVSRS